MEQKVKAVTERNEENGISETQVTVICVCHNETQPVIRVTHANWQRWLARDGFIQEIFPDLSADERELLLTGTCDKFWQEIPKD